MSRRINKKANHGIDHVDRISDLPRNIIDGILECLPIRDVVRTSILSSKWRYMWLSVPRLEFGEDFFEGLWKNRILEDHAIPSVITEVLMLHDGPVYKFTLDIPSDYSFRIRCLSQWILFLSMRRIKDLVLLNQQGEPYEMPSHLFSCLELTYLELSYFTLALPRKFNGFKSLVGLHLYDIEFEESNALERLTSGCPLLEELTISYCSGFECFNISAPKLNILYIEDNRVFESVCFKKSKNLIDLTIIIARSGENFEEGRRSNLINFFSCLPKLERLCLLDGYIKVLSAGNIPKKLPRSINSLKDLELSSVNFARPGEFLFIICLIRSSPNLEKLRIKGHGVVEQPVPLLEEMICSGDHLSRLHTVYIQVKTVCEPIMELVQFLLAHSPSLEILTFKVGLGLRPSDGNRLLNISRELLKKGRASPKAEINFLYDGIQP